MKASYLLANKYKDFKYKRLSQYTKKQKPTWVINMIAFNSESHLQKTTFYPAKLITTRFIKFSYTINLGS